MTKFITLERGEPYPLAVVKSEGAGAQFLMQSGNILQIALPGMDSKQQNALRSGMIKAGFLYEGGSIVVTMPPAMTLKFLSAVQDQLAAINKPGVMAGWLQQEPHDLIKQTENWILGT
jgi:hypothetical protein